MWQLLKNEATRAYIYTILIAAKPLTVYYGVLEEQESVLWIDLGATILGLALARGNTSTKRGGAHGTTATDKEGDVA